MIKTMQSFSLKNNNFESVRILYHYNILVFVKSISIDQNRQNYFVFKRSLMNTKMTIFIFILVHLPIQSESFSNSKYLLGI